MQGPPHTQQPPHHRHEMKMGSAARRRAQPVIPPPWSACHRGASFADRAMYPCEPAVDRRQKLQSKRALSDAAAAATPLRTVVLSHRALFRPLTCPPARDPPFLPSLHNSSAPERVRTSGHSADVNAASTPLVETTRALRRRGREPPARLGPSRPKRRQRGSFCLFFDFFFLSFQRRVF